MMRWSLFLTKFQPLRLETLLKRDSSKGNLLNMQNVQDNFFYRTPPVAAFEIKQQ